MKTSQIRQRIETYIFKRSWVTHKQNIWKKSTPRHIIVKLLKIKISFENSERKVTLYLWRKNHSNYSKYLTRERKTYFLSAERKELSTQNLISSKNISQEWWRNQGILRWKKAKRICWTPVYHKRMIKVL